MELELIREDLIKQLKSSRYLHSVGVEEVSYDMAVIHECDSNKAITAGILHDCAKYLSDEELLMACEKYHLPVSDVERECAFLLHAKVGAVFAQLKYGVEDEEVLSAITYHTTGRPAMTLLEKIIFTADYIEPNRKPLPRINDIRKAAYDNLDLAVYLVLENVLNYLNENGNMIDTLTIETYQYYKELLKME